jgi:branched-chain amino acid transport system ATP-binding protein
MTKPVLSVREIVAGYGEMTILNGTTFNVMPGTITTVIGPNGAGKSTVFKTIFGMLKARSGSIHFKNSDITNLTPRKLLAQGLCYVPQGRNIFPELSVLHNLELGGIAASAETNIAQRVDSILERFPMLRRKGQQQAGTLSGGEQKLLEIARSLLLDPQLMLIDEPSIGLSPMMVQEVFSIIKELRAKGVSILMIEQNARSALEISDDGLVLELGRTRMQDRAQALLNDPRVGQLFLGGVIEENTA